MVDVSDRWVNLTSKLNKKIWRKINPLHELVSLPDMQKIKSMKRFTNGICNVIGKEFAFSDSTGFLHSLNEIFVTEVYRFRCIDRDPFIIDCGANIGLSIVYFKKIFPNSKILAFEPDPDIFKLLERNVVSMGFENVQLINAAVWDKAGTIEFFREGSLAGSANLDFSGINNRVLVTTIKLRDYLNQHIDFLKMDIEGAENVVIPDILDYLHEVDHLFFEYHSEPNSPQKLGELLDTVTQRGFRYTLKDFHGPRYPFVDVVGKGFDMQCNVYCVRK